MTGRELKTQRTAQTSPGLQYNQPVLPALFLEVFSVLAEDSGREQAIFGVFHDQRGRPGGNILGELFVRLKPSAEVLPKTVHVHVSHQDIQGGRPGPITLGR